ncbi:MAG: hypothetical protein Q6K95_07155 [Gloeomargarita sp. GXS_bins_116]
MGAVSQHFQNQEPQPIEREQRLAGLRCAERVITGRVEEKEVAFARYDEAIQEEHGPYLHGTRSAKLQGFVAMVDFWPEFNLPQRIHHSSWGPPDQNGAADETLFIYGFGSTYEQLFPGSQPHTAETLATATQYVQQLKANLGGTKIYPVWEQAIQRVSHWSRS